MQVAQRTPELSPEVEKFISFNPFGAPEVLEARKKIADRREEAARLAEDAVSAREEAQAASREAVEAEIDGKSKAEQKKLQAEADRLRTRAETLHERAEVAAGLVPADEWDALHPVASVAAQAAVDGVRGRIVDLQSELSFHREQVMRIERELNAAERRRMFIIEALSEGGRKAPGLDWPKYEGAPPTRVRARADLARWNG